MPVSPNLKDNYTFGFPVYALHNCLQDRGIASKWNPKARMGLYIGPSPIHTSSIYFIFNLETAMISPQLHVYHKNSFKTMRPIAGNSPSLSHCKQLSWFKRDSHHNIQPTDGGSGSYLVIPEQDQQGNTLVQKYYINK